VNCACHNEPAYWSHDTRYKNGGFWRCGVKHRDLARARYDNDPVHRITKRLRQDARDRRLTVERRRAALRAGG
jgi:hypothetical protein